MKSADFVWDEAKLNRFIANPDEIVPGNNMKPYGRLASADDRAKILAFLRSLATGNEDEGRQHCKLLFQRVGKLTVAIGFGAGSASIVLRRGVRTAT